MSSSFLEHTIRIAGLLHFVQVPAMLLVPKTLDWERDLKRLMPINRQLFGVVVGGIVLCVLGLGLVVAWCPQQMVTTQLGRSLSGFLACFWGYRAAVQFLVYRRTWPASAQGAHIALCLLFPSLAFTYAANVGLNALQP